MEEPVEEKSAVAPPLHQSEGAASISVENWSGMVSGLSDGSEPSNVSYWRALSLLFNKTWLLNTFGLCRVFSGRCILPAVLLTSGGLCLTVGEFFSFSQVHAVTQLSSILAAMGILIVTMILVLGFVISGFGLWLVRLTTFSHAFFRIDMSSKLPSASELDEIFASSQAFILARKKYIAQFYFVISLVMLTPVLAFLTLFSVKALTMTPPESGSIAIKAFLPPIADLAITLLLAVIGGYLVGVSFCAVTVSSSSKQTANLAAWECIKLSFRMLLPMITIVVVVVLMNTIIATPQICLHPIEVVSLVNTTQSLPSSICAELWEGITSVMLFNLTLAPFCELLRYRVK